jgi:hypothetical protein
MTNVIVGRMMALPRGDVSARIQFALVRSRRRSGGALEEEATELS